MAGDCVAEAAAQLLPLQCGVKVSDSCLTTTMGVQQLVSKLPSNGPWAVLQVDLRNAFNSISREEVLVVVGEHTPQLLPWVTSCYGAHSKLYCQGKATLSSEEGVQQGDPLGPLLFALA